jgi:hypothetical protein
LGTGDPEVLGGVECGEEACGVAGVGGTDEGYAAGREFGDSGGVDGAEVDDPGIVLRIDGDGVGEVEAAAGEAVSAGENLAGGIEFDEVVADVAGDPDVAE